MSTAPVEPRALAVVPEASGELSVEQMIQQTQKIQRCMQAVMKRDEHYGVIPGTGTKPTLLKPGAEKLCLMFRLDPEYEVMSTVETGDRISYMIRCVLYHIPTGARVASGLGSCNSREEKYMRAAPKKCPSCGKEAIKRSKFPPRDRPKDTPPGWYCHDRAGGCGANYNFEDAAITEQETGIKDPADLANTLLKMACKRALIAAVLNGTAASDFFTQDLEDLATKAAAYTDVEATPVDPKAPTGETSTSGFRSPTPGTPSQTRKEAPPVNPKANGAAGVASAGSASAPTKPPAAPRANTVQHDGTFASPDQVRLLHALRPKVGGLVVCSDRAPCPSTKMCAYHKQLAAFKNVDGKPIATSTDLSEAQIENLIGRYRAQINRQAERAQQEPDIGAVIPGGGCTETYVPPQARISASNTSTLHGYLHKQGMTELELCSIFGVDAVAELTDDQSASALALVMAHGTSNYERVLAKVQQAAGET